MGVFSDIGTPEGLLSTLIDTGLLKKLDPELRQPVADMFSGKTPDFSNAVNKVDSDMAARQPQQNTTPAPKPQAKPEPSVDSLSRRIYGK
jgi:hypothetical protein